jgi:hypothetical protein
MALNEIFKMCYIIECQDYEGSGDLGMGIAKIVTNLITLLGVV